MSCPAFPRPWPLRALLCAAASLAVPAQASVYRVGNLLEPGCTHATLPAAILAAAGHAGPDDILLAESANYSNLAVVIQDPDALRIQGGFDLCDDNLPSGNTVLNGRSGDSLMTVLGTGTLTLENLTLQNGREASSSFGGGLDIGYAGAIDRELVVTLKKVTVTNNSAGFGGGIHVTGARARLRLLDAVRVSGNTASLNGGGVLCRNGAGMFMRGVNSSVVSNNALNGGGIRGENCILELANAGTGIPLVWANGARDGGGISLTGQNSVLTMYTTHSGYPASILGNFAEGDGGGLALLSSARAALFDTSIEHNTARGSGAAVYQFDNDDAPRSYLTMESARDATLWPRPATAVACAPLRCNRVVGNIARAEDGSWRDGALVYAFGGGRRGYTSTVLHGTAVFENQGRTLIRGADERSFNDPLLIGTTFQLRNAVVVRNASTASLFDIVDQGNLALLESTLAANTIGAASVIYQEGHEHSEVIVERSLIEQAGKSTVTRGGSDGTTRIGSSMTRDVIPAGLTSAPNLVGSPNFVNAPLDDYTPQYQQAIVDYAMVAADHTQGMLDFAGNARAKDLAAKQNAGGDPARIQDIGALERQLDGADPPLHFAVAAATVDEGDCVGNTCESRTVRFTVSLPRPAPFETRVDFRTANPPAGVAFATAGLDYVAYLPTTLVFPLGTTQRTVDVNIVGDNEPEYDEEFLLQLSSALPASTGISPTAGSAAARIGDNDRIRVTLQPLPPRIEGTGAGNAPAEFTVTLNRPLPPQADGPFLEPLLVPYHTEDGAALQGEDYIATSGTLAFYPGRTSLAIAVPVVRDATPEPLESFALVLESASGPLSEPATLDAGTQHLLLLDDDGPEFQSLFVDGFESPP